MDYIIKDNYNNVRERIHQCIVNANKKYSSKATDLQKNFTLKADDKIINIETIKSYFLKLQLLYIKLFCMPLIDK